MLNNNFFYTQLGFASVPQKDSYYIHDDTKAFFILLLQLNFDFSSFFSHFIFFFFRNILIFFGVFLWVFDNSYLPFL